MVGEGKVRLRRGGRARRKRESVSRMLEEGAGLSQRGQGMSSL